MSFSLRSAQENRSQFAHSFGRKHGSSYSFRYSTGIVILLGVAFRLILALSRTDYIWPDEQFQALEPASAIVFGNGLLSWEWKLGYRPWTIPALYLPILFICKWLGISGGSFLILSSRLFTAAASGWLILRLDRILFTLKMTQYSRLLTLTLFSFSPAMMLWSCATLADTWVMIVFWGTLPNLLNQLKKNDSMGWFQVGLLTGIPILLKTQSVFAILGLGLSLLIMRAPIRLFLFWVLGILTNLISLGMIDYFTWGTFFQSLIQQYKIGNSTGILNGTSPWWQYFPLITQNLSYALILLLASSFLAFLIWIVRQPTKWPLLPKSSILILIPCILFTLFHIVIPHKETRFLLPIFPSIFILIGIFLDPLLKRVLPRVPPFFRSKKIWILSPVFFVITGSYALHKALSAPLPFTAVNTVDLETQIYRDKQLSIKGDSCILLIGQSWAWTRGYSVIGKQVEYRERKFPEVTKEDLNQCIYAIVDKSLIRAFHLRSFPEGWNYYQPSKRGFVLFVNHSLLNRSTK